jgi:hypothetical protein
MLQLQSIADIFSEYAVLGLALEHHRRLDGCNHCGAPTKAKDLIKQQDYRAIFLHYISLLHGMALLSLSRAKEPIFQVLFSFTSAAILEVCCCFASPQCTSVLCPQRATTHSRPESPRCSGYSYCSSTRTSPSTQPITRK